MQPKVLVIVGPTAVGKTALSIELAKRYDGEIINGDSMQVYQQLSIGTAKITPEDMAGVPHHLLDFLPVDSVYNASLFQQLAKEKIEAIASRGKLPIIVGGTGLYIEGLLYGMTFGGSGSFDASVREKWQTFLDTNGVDALYSVLLEKDAEAAEKIGRGNPRRLVRALEVIEQTGQKFSQQMAQDALFDAYVIGLNTDRDVLYERINQRVDDMLDKGLLAEAKWLYDQPIGDCQSKMAIGYKELFPYFEQKDTLDNCVNQLKQNSRRYAKRQLTWFRNRMSVQWYDVCQTGEKSTLLEEVATWLNV